MAPPILKPKVNISLLKDDYFKEVWEHFSVLQEAKQLTDLVLMSEEGQNFPVHKAVVIPACPVLAGIVWWEGRQEAVILAGASSDDIRCLVSLLYTGSCSLRPSLQSLASSLGLVLVESLQESPSFSPNSTSTGSALRTVKEAARPELEPLELEEDLGGVLPAANCLVKELNHESLICEKCDEKFSDAVELFRHQATPESLKSCRRAAKNFLGVGGSSKIEMVKNVLEKVKDIPTDVEEQQARTSAIKQMTEQIPHPLVCKHCSKEFTRSSSRLRHQNSAGTCDRVKRLNPDKICLPKKRLNCAYCDKQFRLEENWKNHLKNCRSNFDNCTIKERGREMETDSNRNVRHKQSSKGSQLHLLQNPGLVKVCEEKPQLAGEGLASYSAEDWYCKDDEQSSKSHEVFINVPGEQSKKVETVETKEVEDYPLLRQANPKAHKQTSHSPCINEPQRKRRKMTNPVKMLLTGLSEMSSKDKDTKKTEKLKNIDVPEDVDGESEVNENTEDVVAGFAFQSSKQPFTLSRTMPKPINRRCVKI